MSAKQVKELKLLGTTSYASRQQGAFVVVVAVLVITTTTTTVDPGKDLQLYS